jgi:hypothetical protein
VSTTALSWAVRLALDVETCRDLLNGQPVDPARLDPDWLETAKAFRFVTLDISALDLLPTIQHARQMEEATAA